MEKILDQTTALYEAYDRFYTMLNLADIYYCLDLSNADCQAEYEYCMSQSALVDQALEEILPGSGPGAGGEGAGGVFRRRVL